MPRRKAPRLHSGLPREDCAGCTPQDQDEIRRGRIGALKAMTGYGADLETYDFSEPLSAAQSAGEREAKSTCPPGATDLPLWLSGASRPPLSGLVSDRRRRAQAGLSGDPQIQERRPKWPGMVCDLQSVHHNVRRAFRRLSI